MTSDIPLRVDASDKRSLVEQIRQGLGAAVREGRLRPGARLPSWRDMAAQLGVSRGTVRAAYERLVDEQVIVASGAAGTFVASRPPRDAPAHPSVADCPPMPDMYPTFSLPPRVFQMGVPAQDVFPFKTWSRMMSRGARLAASQPVSYPDPRGDPALRSDIAAYLSIARGMTCLPTQILVTNGYAGALGLAVRALGLEGASAWMEEPGYPMARTALALARVAPVPVPVDDSGLDVAAGEAMAGDARLAVVTPGQQAPLGVTLTLARRLALLEWAVRRGAWIIEDDYLSELQLKGRAAPALASLDRAGRVIHIGTFSKTISPALRLGFVVVPMALAARFGEVAAVLAPAPACAVQRAVSEFMREGLYLRHLRRMKRVYAQRRDAIMACLRGVAPAEAMAGLAVMLRLPDGAPDVEIAARAYEAGMAPVPLSPWYAGAGSRAAGLLLGVTNASEDDVAARCAALDGLIRGYM